MNLLLKLGPDWYYSNLLIINKVAIIILDEYKQDEFCNIISAYCNPKENNTQYHIISSNSIIYMPFYYILFFLHNDLGLY